MTKGIDTAYYDGLLDWEKYTWDFAYIKISEGTVPDPAFLLQWEQSRRHTFRGAYHYFRSFVDPELAAIKCSTLLADDFGELPLALDLESTDDRGDVLDRALKFQKSFKNISGYYPIIYTSPSFINRTKMYLRPEFAEYDLWLATYTFDNYSDPFRKQIIHDILIGDRQIPVPLPPKPFKSLSFYQWTSRGDPLDVPGYTNQRDKKAVDFDLFNGTRNQLIGRYKISTPTNEGDEMTDTITLTADLKSGYTANVRAIADKEGSLLGTISGPINIRGIGQKINNDGYDWIQIIYPRTGFIALTSQFENIVYTPPVTETTSRKIIKSTLFFNDNTTVDLFPKE